MTNRIERRRAAGKARTAARRLKLRCIGCERVGRTMTKEHIWPKWLIARANLDPEGVRWFNGNLISASSATIPLCGDCNHALGAELEGPVSLIFEDMESGRGLSDMEAELLVRWLWKFEGLFWNSIFFAHPHLRYSDLWTLRERVLGPSMEKIRPALALAVSLTENNDEGFSSWPVGIDSGITEFNGLFVSGVFCRTAMMVLLDGFSDLVPASFGLYRLAELPDTSGAKIFFPPVGFRTAKEAIDTTVAASVQLTHEHNELGREHHERKPLLMVRQRRVEIP